MTATPSDIGAAVTRWLEVLDRDLGTPITGCYLVGSIAVGDFAPPVSNIDVVVCGDTPWSDDDRQAIVDTASRLERRGRAPHVDVVTFDQLEGFGDVPDPYTRDLLYDAPALRGRRRPPAAQHDGDLEAWAVRQLTERAGPWVQSAKRLPLRGWLKAGISPMLLDTCRWYAAAQGHVLSKSEAAEMVLAEASRPALRRKILGEALSYRYGSSTSNYWGPVERKQDMVRLMEELLDAAAIPARSGGAWGPG